MSVTDPAWRDPVGGNSLAQLVNFAISEIVSAEPEPWRYDPELYPALAVKMAVDQLETARGRFLISKPVAHAARS